MSSKQTFSNATYERYALALYELAKEEHELEKTEIEANSIKQLFKSSEDFKNIVVSPTIGQREKSTVILKIADTFRFSKTFKKFLGFLTLKVDYFF